MRKNDRRIFAGNMNILWTRYFHNHTLILTGAAVEPITQVIINMWHNYIYKLKVIMYVNDIIKLTFLLACSPHWNCCQCHRGETHPQGAQDHTHSRSKSWGQLCTLLCLSAAHRERFEEGELKIISFPLFAWGLQLDLLQQKIVLSSMLHQN